MIENLKPYPETKDSGLPWLGDLPAHWVIKRGKSYLQAIDKRSNSGEEELLTVSSTRGVVLRRSANVTMFKANSYAGHKLCWPGDLVINSLWAWNSGLGVSHHHGIVSTAYGVYRARNTSEVNPYYLHELLRSSAFQWELQVRSKGVWISRLQLTDTAFLDAPIPLPPPDEQAAIARFLAWATNRLDRAIGAKRRIIALLQEQKQAIIHRAVTRGLDPSVPLKNSGIPWLGEIPEHWEVRRLKDLATVQTGITLGKDYGSTPVSLYPYLRVANVQSDCLDLQNVKHIAVPEAEAKRSTLVSGDVLMTEGGDIDKLGRGCLWSGELSGCLHQNHVFAVRCSSGLIPGFLVALMGSAHGRVYFQITAKQTTNLASTNSTTLKAFPLPLPEIQEQQDILSFIDRETQDLSRGISDTEREIALLREYRTRLIADVVTGKLDVREVAAGLPEEIESDDVQDATEEDPDLDVEDEVPENLA